LGSQPKPGVTQKNWLIKKTSESECTTETKHNYVMTDEDVKNNK